MRTSFQLLQGSVKEAGGCALADMIHAGVDEPGVEQLERFHQVLRNSGTAELSCSESFIAPAEHVSIFAQCRTPTRRP
jgi:hypothetical protein